MKDMFKAQAERMAAPTGPRQIPLANAPAPSGQGRLSTIIEYRLVHGIDTPTVLNPRGTVNRPYLIGHGQQIARRDAAAKQAALIVMYRDTPAWRPIGRRAA